MSAKDIIKSSIYENMAGNTGLPFLTVLFTLLTTCLLGIFIREIYKLTGKAEFYSKNLSITIAGCPIVVATIMIAMQSNLIVSLGMVGALSIVRFRNAVKNSLDLLFLFWTISVGIICGVGLKLLAVALCAMMTILILVLQMLPDSKGSAVLVLRTTVPDVDWDDIRKILRHHAKFIKERTFCYRHEETEVIFELRVSNKDDLLHSLQQHKELQQISFLTYDGEYRV